MLLVSKKKVRGNHAFFRDDKALMWKKCHTFLCILLSFLIIVAQLSLKKMSCYPQFSFWIPIALAKIFFTCIVINRARMPR